MENKDYVCVKCGAQISEKVHGFSLDNYGKPYCFECQKTEQKIEKLPRAAGFLGDDFVSHQDLLKAAHELGVVTITTEMLTKPEDPIAVFKAIVTMEITKGKDKILQTFVGHGDADAKSVNSTIAPHKIRMAETRAINRALRLATNIGKTSIEELGEK